MNPSGAMTSAPVLAAAAPSLSMVAKGAAVHAGAPSNPLLHTTSSPGTAESAATAAAATAVVVMAGVVASGPCDGILEGIVSSGSDGSSSGDTTVLRTGDPQVANSSMQVQTTSSASDLPTDGNISYTTVKTPILKASDRREVLEAAVPLVAIMGQGDMHQAIVQNFPYSQGIRFISVTMGHSFPKSKPKRLSFEGYEPLGMLKHDWVQKYSRAIPYVCCILVEYDEAVSWDRQSANATNSIIRSVKRLVLG